MCKKIRILFAVGTMGRGGAERQLLGILKHLDRTRFEPLLYLASCTGGLLPEVPEDVPVFAFDRRCLKLPRIRWPGRVHEMRVRDMANVIRENQIDLVYDRTSHMTLLSGPATKLAQCKRISVIVSNPQMDLTHYEHRFRWVKRRLLKQAYQTADVVIAVSDGVKQNTIDYYDVPESLVRTIYNPIDIARIDRFATEDVVSYPSNEFHVVSSGRLHPHKGCWELLEAANILIHQRQQNSFRFHILGEGSIHNELQAAIVEKKLEAYFFLEGFQKNPFRWLKQANLFCLPSLMEGLPNVLLEAMACQVPVLSADCPSGPREILQGDQFGSLVPPGDALALADAMEDALKNNSTWKEKVPAARKRVEETFALSIGMQKLEELFLELHDG